MTRASILTSALLLGAAAFSLSTGSAIAAAEKAEKSADAAKKTQCEREAAMQLYVAKQKKRAYFARCLAGKELPPEKGVARRGLVRPSGAAGIPRPSRLGGANPPSTATGSLSPSNAPTAPSAPVIGSTGTSTTGSSATSISGSSGSSLGSSGSTTGSGR